VPGTKATSSDSGSVCSQLAAGIKTDEEHDSRPCPHDDCHGTLTLTDAENVVCASCRCTPDGIYLPPQVRGHNGTTLARYRGTAGTWSHDTYDNSTATRLAGGYEAVYDEEDRNRPSGVGTEYTFDLSTL